MKITANASRCSCRYRRSDWQFKDRWRLCHYRLRKRVVGRNHSIQRPGMTLTAATAATAPPAYAGGSDLLKQERTIPSAKLGHLFWNGSCVKDLLRVDNVLNRCEKRWRMREKQTKSKADTDIPIAKPSEPLPPWFESGRGTGFLTRREQKSFDKKRDARQELKIAAFNRLRRISRSR